MYSLNTPHPEKKDRNSFNCLISTHLPKIYTNGQTIYQTLHFCITKETSILLLHIFHTLIVLYMNNPLQCENFIFHNRLLSTKQLSWSHHFESFTVATMTWLTVMEYLCHKWPRICSTCRKHFPGVTSGAGTAYPSGAPRFTPGF